MTNENEDCSFVDLEGRVWKIPEIKVSHVMSLGKDVGIDLNDLITEGHLWQTTNQAMICVGSVLWHFCKKQHDGTEEDFFEAFDADTFDSAQQALAIRVANFTPAPRRKEMKRLFLAMEKARDMGAAEATERIVELEGELLKNVLSEQEKQGLPTLETTAYVN